MDGEGHFPLLCSVVETEIRLIKCFSELGAFSFLEWWLKEDEEEEYTETRA